MATAFLAFVILMLVMGGMAIGLILRGKPIKGSCGGIASLGMGTACDICGGNPQKCEKEEEGAGKKAKQPAKLFYDASGG